MLTEGILNLNRGLITEIERHGHSNNFLGHISFFHLLLIYYISTINHQSHNVIEKVKHNIRSDQCFSENQGQQYFRLDTLLIPEQ